MQPPVVTRHRRPFLLPVWLTLLAVLTAVGVGLALSRTASTTVVVVARPVEKQLGTIEDPPLSPEGEQRAQQLAQWFGHNAGAGHLDAIYVSEARRAQRTAAPLAERLGKKPIVVPGKDAEDFAGRVMDEHGGDTVLVIGSGDLAIGLVRELSGMDMDSPSDREPDSMYIVSIPSFGNANVLRLKY